jgi:hypothetical protein
MSTHLMSRRLAIGGACLVTATAVTIWLLWPDPPLPPRARQYLEFTACLFTDESGIGRGPGAAAWAGMQDASLTTHAKVQYLSVTGPATTANALPYLASLLQRRCAVIVAVGQAQIQAVLTDAPAHPQTQFVVLANSGAPNVTFIQPNDDTNVRNQIAKLIGTAVADAPK